MPTLSLPVLTASPRVARASDWLNRHRRFVAASLAAVTLLAVINAINASHPATSVAVATHALGAGTTITSSDVGVRSLPTSMTAGAATNLADLVGRTLLVPLVSGQPISTAFALDQRVIPAGYAAVPLRPAEATVAAIVRPGERVDVIGQLRADTAPSLLANNLVVLTVTTPRTSGFLKSTSEASLIVVLANTSVAAQLAGASLAGPVAIALRS